MVGPRLAMSGVLVKVEVAWKFLLRRVVHRDRLHWRETGE
jgi:hypothetical protein